MRLTTKGRAPSAAAPSCPSAARVRVATCGAGGGTEWSKKMIIRTVKKIMVKKLWSKIVVEKI